MNNHKNKSDKGIIVEFDVVLSDDTLDRVSRLLFQAELFGQGVQAGFAYATILNRLRANPFTYGELMYHVATGAGVYHRATRPLSVWYVVYEEPRVVWIVRVDRMSPPTPNN